MKRLSDYKVNDCVSVLIDNIRTGGDEWRTAMVKDVRWIHPTYGSKHPPYPIIVVKVIRTYCKENSDGKIEFFDKLNTEIFIYAEQVRDFDKDLNNTTVQKRTVWSLKNNIDNKHQIKIIKIDNDICYYIANGEKHYPQKTITKKELLESFKRYMYNEILGR